MQMTITLLETEEAEYVVLSMLMRDVIYFVNLITEMKDVGSHLPAVPNLILCTESLKTL